MLPDNYSAHLFQAAGRYTVERGTITVDTSNNLGVGILHMTGGAPGFSYTLQFCPYPSQLIQCNDLATFTANAQSDNTVSFTMPKGTWSGVFQVNEEASGEFALSGMATNHGRPGHAVGNAAGFNGYRWS